MPSSPQPDPRPLTGEPLALDLLNTRWMTGGPHDLLDSLGGLEIWLGTDLVRHELVGRSVPADQRTLDALLQAREALSDLVRAGEAVAEGPVRFDDALTAGLNAVLAHGRIRQVLEADGPGTVVEVDDPSWLPAWLAAESFLRLLEDRPERLRKCANPQCVLHFYDISKNGTRRWCSMAGCGNRAKARRHYARRSD